MMNWTAAHDARLTEMWNDGLSSIEIGRRLNVTKNSVIGRVHRLHLSSRASPIKGARPAGWVAGQKKPTPIKLTVASEAKTQMPIALMRTNELLPGPIHPTPYVRVNQRLPIPVGTVGRASTCQWTECERAPWLMCDAPSVTGYSWCAAHKKRVFTDKSQWGQAA